MKKKFLFPIIFLFLISLVSGVKVTQTNTGDGLDVRFSQFAFITYGSDVEFPFHVFSRVDGVAQFSDVNCSFHLYNKMGDHLVDLYDDVPAQVYDYEFLVGANNFSVGETYAYITYCECDACGVQGATLGGFASSSFFVTADGEAKNINGTGLLAIIILIPLIFGLFMLIGGATMGEDHNVLRIFLFLLSVPMVWVSLHFSLIGLVKYYGLVELQNLIGSTTYWMGWLFFVLISYFVIYAIWKASVQMAQDKDAELKY